MSDPRASSPPPLSYGPATAPPTNGFAVAALVIGIVTLALSVIPFVNLAGASAALVGIALGVAGIGRGRRTGRGAAMAGWGIGLGAIAVAVSGFVTFWAYTYLGDLLDFVKPPEPTAQVGEWFTTDGGDMRVRVTSIDCSPDPATVPEPAATSDCFFVFDVANDSDHTIGLGDITVKSVVDGEWDSADLFDPASAERSYGNIDVEPGTERTLNGTIDLYGDRLDGIVFDANDASSHSAVVVDAGGANEDQ